MQCFIAVILDRLLILFPTAMIKSEMPHGSNNMSGCGKTLQGVLSVVLSTSDVVVKG